MFGSIVANNRLPIVLAGDFSLEGVDLSLEMEKPLFDKRINSPPRSGICSLIEKVVDF